MGNCTSSKHTGKQLKKAKSFSASVRRQLAGGLAFHPRWKNNFGQKPVAYGVAPGLSAIVSGIAGVNSVA